MSDALLRGTKTRFYPSKCQAATLDLWRRRCRELWNVLLELQHAAYNGENARSRLGWRKTWTRTIKDDHAEAERVYLEGKKRKDGTWIKEPGVGREEERAALVAQRKLLKKGTKAHDELSEKIRAIAPKPVPLDPVFLDKINWKWRHDGAPLDERMMHKLFGTLGRAVVKGKGGCDHSYRHTLAWLERKKLSAKADDVIAWLKEHDGPCDCAAARKSSKHYAEILKACQPRLLWHNDSTKQDLQKLMARLKQHPLTHWIADLPSHAAQKTVSDMVEAIKAMIREKKKGADGRKTGFPRRKPNHYAAGSVYFANTQLQFEKKQGAPGRKTPKGAVFARVKFPNGVGWVECRMNRKIGEAFEYGEADLMGGRVWRQGEDWYLSCQWKVPKPAPLPSTGRTAGVKIAAAIPLTIYDDRGQTTESAKDRTLNGVPLEMPPINKDLLAHHAAAGRAQSRALEARKRRAKKREAYYRKRHAQKLEKGIVAKKPRRARIPLTPGFYRAAATLAKLEGADRDKREDWMHQITTTIVRNFDVIAVQKMEVARMMKKPRPAEDEQEQRKPTERKRRSLKAARVMMRRVAMARIQQTLKYKALDLRGEHAYEELDALYPVVQPCSRCGVIHPEMKDGRPIMRCAEPLPDGTICGNILKRNRNAVRIVARELANRLKQRKGAA